ncbi:MAG: cytochrome c3 family protein [bacterium]|nr:cytochrome c3 family protein [bacterium]
MKRHYVGILMVALALSLCCALVANAQIVGTKHDLSLNGGGYWAGNDPANQVCVYCHTPHAASTTQKPLWNRAATAETFIPYTSLSYNGGNYAADPTGHQPMGESKLCLSCHDGITALNALLHTYGPPIQMVGGFDQLGDVYYPGSPYSTGMGANIGENFPGGAGSGHTINNLANDHPVSFAFNNALILEDAGGGAAQLQLPATGSAIKLFGTNGDQLECSSCHNVHSNTNAPFLAMSNNGSAICLTCHIK